MHMHGAQEIYELQPKSRCNGEAVQDGAKITMEYINNKNCRSQITFNSSEGPHSEFL